MKIEQLLFNNQIIIKAFSVIILIYMIVIIIEAVRWIKDINKSSNSGQDDNKIDFTLSLVSFQALSVIIIYVIAYIYRFRLLYALVFLPTLLNGIYGFLSSANKVYLTIEKDERHLSIQQKVSLLIVAIYCFSFSALLPQSVKQIVIDNDIYIILIKVVALSMELFAIICITGLLIGELAYLLHDKKKWKAILEYGTTNKIFREITIVRIWNSIITVSSKITLLIRIPFIVISYLVCLIINVVLTIIYIGQQVVRSCIFIVAYIYKFVEFMAEKAYEISDGQFIWATLRIAVILSLILTKTSLIHNDYILNDSKEIYDYISEAVLIPLILAEILNIKEKFKKDESYYAEDKNKA